jgi:exopolyphosphatase/guanosine-5'-triphosphate,3'-diphosphate pyrophosphatase
VTRAAAVDCGTNTIRLLVADLDPETGAEQELAREMKVVRLGQDVDRTGRLADAALQRVFAAVEEYAATIDRLNVEAFLDGVRQRLGVDAEIISGDQEAALTYDGATRSLGHDVAAPYLVVDIGGGSTELILGDGHGRVRAARSLDIGSVRMTERRMPSDPPTEQEVAAAVADVDAALDGCPVPVEEAATLIGVAGTVTTVAAHVLGLPGYDRERVHHAVLAADEVHRGTAQLLAMTVAERRALPYMHPGRADVIGGGALILDRVLRHTKVGSVLVSETDILDGIAWSVA